MRPSVSGNGLRFSLFPFFLQPMMREGTILLNAGHVEAHTTQMC